MNPWVSSDNYHEELEMLKELCSVLKTVENETKLTPRKYQIYHEYLMCTDYGYYQLIKKTSEKKVIRQGE